MNPCDEFTTTSGGEMDQSVIDRAVAIATRAALNGRPLSSVIWLPPATASSDPRGAFAIVPYRGALSETPPWA